MLLTKNLKASSHKGVLGLFGQHFVKTGVFDKRQIGDYGVGFSITPQEAQGMLKTALRFVDTIKSHLESASVTKSES